MDFFVQIYAVKFDGYCATAVKFLVFLKKSRDLSLQFEKVG